MAAAERLGADLEELAARHEHQLGMYESMRATQDRGPLPVYVEAAPKIAAARVVEVREALPASVPVRLLVRAPDDTGDPLAGADRCAEVFGGQVKRI